MDFIVPGGRWFEAHPLNVRTRANVFYEGFVCHTTVGGSTLAGLGAWFGGGNLRAGLTGSTHYGVSDEPEDVVGQFVSLGRQPIAHGAEAGVSLPIMIGNEGISTNDYLIGYELLDSGVPGNHTPRQLDRLARHMASVWRTEIAPHAHITGAKVDRDHILGHYQLAPSTRTCPVWPEERFQWLIGRVNALLAEAPPPDPEPPADDWERKYYTLAGEAQTWLKDDTQRVMEAATEAVREIKASEILRLDRIEQITKG